MAKYEPKRIEIILDAIGQGMTQKDAGILAGVSEDTISLWKKEKPDFSERMLQKEIEFKRLNVNVIQNASLSGTWQASAWLLERKFPKEFGQRSELDDEAKKNIEKLQQGINNFFKKNVGGKKPAKKTTKNKNTKRA